MPIGLAGLLGDVPPSLDELKKATKNSTLIPVKTAAVKRQNLQNNADLKEQSTQPQLDTTDNDFLSSILDQVTSGLKSQYSLPLTPQSNNVQSMTQNNSRDNNTQNKSKNNYKNKNKNRRRRHKKKAPVEPSIHRDTPAESNELDFDSEMDRYFKASSTQKETKKEEPKEIEKEAPKRQMTIEEVAEEILGRPKKKFKSTQNNKSGKAAKPKKEWVPLVPCKYYAQGYCKDAEKCTFKHESINDPEVCPLWIKGKCKNDDLCRFKHEGPRDIKICQFYKAQSCTKGDQCPFSHELNLEPCRFFHLQKTCEQGELCPYSHDPLTPESLERLRKLTGPCRFWQFKGYCVTGDDCLFAHDEISEEERKKLESTITPCIYYHLKGGCRSGDDCFYLHNEATAEQLKLN
ncbi:hypothetical protein G6F61_004193 [Rhizopus arrhizus]|nr:hypothetical protein G6F23_011760 [Rhizopus arrhizus]KAG0753469.1 hypothetical protein G6F24_012979 [Rhizopus arrhizus]KAG0928408.1 hypothetical protein G6F32_012578 [Rhizopus arrhizus]KAG1289840.1 hypothetical protein G6F66_009151 [Rhizopus arrhizus]KAG1380294.1 hypothetical protein G6F61_004193 [Rhizopus arrhizus]